MHFISYLLIIFNSFSLSSGDGGATTTGTHTTAGNTTEIQYGPGPSLRPQTEGSWTQGGSRPVVPPSVSDAPPRSNSSGPLAAPPQLPVQVGQQAPPPLPPQFRGVMPPFMYRNNFAPNGPVSSNAPPSSLNGRNRLDARPSSRHVDVEEITHRPIIKEEDLNKMDDIAKDTGWASHDDIDYNQKLAFSDDESPNEKELRKEHKSNDKDLQQSKSDGGYTQEPHVRASWSRGNRGGRIGEEDEGLVRRRQQHSEEVAIAVERAKQRKEEEEKRFLESRQAAAKKLHELNEKLKGKRVKDLDESQGTINPSIVPPQPITPAPIPVPDWEKDKDSIPPRTSNENVEEKPQQPIRDSSLDFKQLTKIEGNRSNYSRSAERVSRERDQNYSNRHFQSDLPPRFQRQRQNNPSPASFQYENRWSSHTTVNPPRKADDKEREDYRTPHRSFSESSRKSSEEHEEKRDREKTLKVEKKQDTLDEHDDWHGDRREKYRDERPQRPDSRDSRQSRDSEPRDYGSWADTSFETPYEEKKKESHRDDRRQVPGPITKERIEADDLKSGDKRNLTQLKRGQLPDKKISESKKDDKIDDSWSIKKQTSDSSIASKSWSDTTPLATSSESQKFLEALEKPIKNSNINTEKEESKQEDDEKKSGMAKEKRGPSSRNRSDRSQWASGYPSHRTFSRRGQGRGGRSSGGPQRQSSAKSGDVVGTDSEGSLDEISISTESGRDDRGTKVKKTEKDEKNKEMKGDKSPVPEKKGERQDKRDGYVPRGEPSRLGRGGYNVRRGGMTKKIDGYGPPPSKSPFGNMDDKDKRTSADETLTDLDDKTRQTQNMRKENNQAMTRKCDDRSKDRARKQTDSRRGKPRGKDEFGDTYSDNSEDGEHGRGARKWSGLNRVAQVGRRNPPAPRLSSEKRLNNVETASSQLKSDEKISETETKKDNQEECDNLDAETEERTLQPDSDGFQEVKNKKTGKEKVKGDDKPPAKLTCKVEKETIKNERKTNKTNGNSASQLTQQQISNIPPLMATPVNPPAVLPQPTNKGRFERLRQNVLPPRLMKQKENNRLQKAQMQQNMCDQSDMSKVGQNMGMYGIKDPSSVSVPLSNAWDKPLTGQLRSSLEQEVMSVGMENCKALDQVQSPSQSNSPNAEKVSSTYWFYCLIVFCFF